ncbi:hypothetical protein OG568_60140 (plasmid) [Streptomyces sp. NBC_01450]|uniref:hypothetical protein n=1 Tax=Streptomyces sp. NBC_01450 TaxID=2903871 RepID=UPI002E32546B|nr:hypothetical protein [Streptomyces sp. NBC_01450]
MSRTRSRFFAAVVLVGGLFLTACGGGGTDKASGSAERHSTATVDSSELTFKNGTAKQNNADLNTGDLADDAAPVRQAGDASPVVRKWVQLSDSSVGNLSSVVTNGAGFVLYRFDKDKADPSTSNCFDACQKTWPPLVVASNGKVFIDGINKSDVGFIKRGKGFQVTIGGWPVYLFSKDQAPGDVNGQGVGGTWFGVTPDGQKAGQDSGGSQPEVNPADGGQQGDGEAKRELEPRDQGGTYRIVADAADSESASGIVSGTGCVNTASFGTSISPEGKDSAKPIKIWTGTNCTGKSALLADGSGIFKDFGIDKIKSVFIGQFTQQ